jgi:hypothetical protein
LALRKSAKDSFMGCLSGINSCQSCGRYLIGYRCQEIRIFIPDQGLFSNPKSILDALKLRFKLVGLRVLRIDFQGPIRRAAHRSIDRLTQHRQEVFPAAVLAGALKRLATKTQAAEWFITSVSEDTRAPGPWFSIRMAPAGACAPPWPDLESALDLEAER